MQTFTRSGIALSFPSNWVQELDESNDGGWTLTLQSQQTAFMLLSLRPDAEDCAQVIDEALEALRAEYKEMDIENALETIAERPALGHNIDFLTMDTPIVCWTRCVETPEGPLLIMGQTSEFDRETNDAVLRAIVKSLIIVED